jgi:hypothetical protein
MCLRSNYRPRSKCRTEFEPVTPEAETPSGVTGVAALAVSSTVSACGLGEADFSRMKQENNSKAI